MSPSDYSGGLLKLGYSIINPGRLFNLIRSFSNVRCIFVLPENKQYKGTRSSHSTDLAMFISGHTHWWETPRIEGQVTSV